MILSGEDAENGERKDRSISERVAIGRSMEEIAKGRWGGSRDQDGHMPVLAGETRALAALKSGIGNDRTYRKAKDIVDRGENHCFASARQTAISSSVITCLYSQAGLGGVEIC